MGWRDQALVLASIWKRHRAGDKSPALGTAPWTLPEAPLFGAVLQPSLRTEHPSTLARQSAGSGVLADCCLAQGRLRRLYCET